MYFTQLERGSSRPEGALQPISELKNPATRTKPKHSTTKGESRLIECITHPVGKRPARGGEARKKGKLFTEPKKLLRPDDVISYNYYENPFYNVARQTRTTPCSMSRSTKTAEGQRNWATTCCWPAFFASPSPPLMPPATPTAGAS